MKEIQHNQNKVVSRIEAYLEGEPYPVGKKGGEICTNLLLDDPDIAPIPGFKRRILNRILKRIHQVQH